MTKSKPILSEQQRRSNEAAVWEAVLDGRLALASCSRWLDALAEDPEGARKVLSMMAPCLPASIPTRQEQPEEDLSWF